MKQYFVKLGGVMYYYSHPNGLALDAINEIVEYYHDDATPKEKRNLIAAAVIQKL
jgi:hypothetical protein